MPVQPGADVDPFPSLAPCPVPYPAPSPVRVRRQSPAPAPIPLSKVQQSPIPTLLPRLRSWFSPLPHCSYCSHCSHCAFTLIALLLAFILGHQLSQRLHGARNFTRHIAVYFGQKVIGFPGLLFGEQPLLFDLPRCRNPCQLLPVMALVHSP